MVLKAFYEARKGYKGFFVDVGAHHPVRYSNTLYFYKKGWRGINIEPTPTAMRMFKLLRGRDINLNVGVAEKKGELTFYCFDEPALNSFSQEAALKASASGRYTISAELKIPVVPLREILADHVPPGQKIDFMSVDVEGLDLEVLRSNDWSRFSPEFLLVEGHVEFAKLAEDEVYQFLAGKGYSLVAKTFRTLFFRLNA